MAKRKKSRDTYTSKGEGCNVRKDIINAMRRERSLLDIRRAKFKAFMKGKKVFVTIPNPNTNETNKPFIRVPAEQVWRKEKYIMKTKDPKSL
jgi:hypothetical protein